MQMNVLLVNIFHELFFIVFWEDVFLICFFFGFGGALCVRMVDVLFFFKESNDGEAILFISTNGEEFLIVGRMYWTPFYTNSRLAFGWL